MIKDRNKGFDIRYNLFNLPELMIKRTDGADDMKNRIRFVYSATGERLQKIVTADDRVTQKVNYVNGLVYTHYAEDTASEDEIVINTSFGRQVRDFTAQVGEQQWRYEYELKDHLGNIRVVFTENTDGTALVIQKNTFYPFGMKVPMLCSQSTEYRFIGKNREIIDEHGLNWIYWGKRFLDPQIGRWHSLDPAEQFDSPYVYCGNNPANFVELDGAISLSYHQEQYAKLQSLYRGFRGIYTDSNGWNDVAEFEQMMDREIQESGHWLLWVTAGRSAIKDKKKGKAEEEGAQGARRGENGVNTNLYGADLNKEATRSFKDKIKPLLDEHFPNIQFDNFLKRVHIIGEMTEDQIDIQVIATIEAFLKDPLNIVAANTLTTKTIDLGNGETQKIYNALLLLNPDNYGRDVPPSAKESSWWSIPNPGHPEISMTVIRWSQTKAYGFSNEDNWSSISGTAPDVSRSPQDMYMHEWSHEAQHQLPVYCFQTHPNFKEEDFPDMYERDTCIRISKIIAPSLLDNARFMYSYKSVDSYTVPDIHQRLPEFYLERHRASQRRFRESREWMKNFLDENFK